MIPKKIHYCWFGGNPLPELVQKCIASWRRFCPDYEIVEWNESNYDVTKNAYMHQAYQSGRWGFVPDYARLDIIYTHGGIYLDTDVELIRSPDELLELEAFAGVEQNSEYVALGLGFGAVKGHPAIREMRDYYENISFIKDGEPDLTPAPKINSEALRALGYVFSEQPTAVCGMTVLPSEYFCPVNYDTDELTVTEKTYSIHHYTASWYDESQRYSLYLKRKYRRFLPRKIAVVLATAVAKTKYHGFGACLRWIFKKRKIRKKL